MLLIAFGSLVAAGLPLAIALVGLGITSGGLIVLLANVIDVPNWTTAVSGLIGIGVGIDYALLVLTRFRTALKAGKDRHDAVVEAVTTAGRSVIIAGCTVVIAVLGLFLTGLPYMYGVAISASFAVLVVMLASITLLPALLSYLGPRVDRLRIPFLGRRLDNPEETANSPAARWSHAVQRRPVDRRRSSPPAILLALAAPALGMRLGFPDAGNDPPGHDDPPGLRPDQRGLRPRRQRPAGDRRRTARRRRRKADDRHPCRGICAKRTASPSCRRPASTPDGTAAIITVIPTTSPQDEATSELVDHLRGDVDPGARSATPASTALVGGVTAALEDQSDLHHRPHAAVHRRRRRALVPAAAGRLPLAADLAEGGRS